MKKRNATTLDNFFLRSRREEGHAKLYFRLQRKEQTLTLRTNITVDIEQWQAAIQSASAWRHYTQDTILMGRDGTVRVLKSDGGMVAQEMTEFRESLKALEREGKATPENLHQLAESAGSKRRGDSRQLDHICRFYDYSLKCMKEGLMRYHGRRYSERSIGIWEEFAVYLKGYVDAELTFGDIDRSFIDGFRLWLEKRGLMRQTMECQIGLMRKLCRTAAEYGQNRNALSLTGWKTCRATDTEKRAEVYLTDEEIDALYSLPLEKKLDEVRDLFVLGCLSFQRWSDYSRLRAENFITNSEGVRVIALHQQKTGTYVEVPITDNRVELICQKYDYNLPKVSRKRMNERLKLVMQRLAEQIPSMRELYVTVLSVAERRSEDCYAQLKVRVERGERLTTTERRRYRRLHAEAVRRGGMPLFARNEEGQVVREKHELVSTHTSRRSSITNMYKQGLLDNRQMMALSGHRTERVFENYIKIGTAEQAKRIFDKLKDVKR